MRSFEPLRVVLEVLFRLAHLDPEEEEDEGTTNQKVQELGELVDSRVGE